MTRGKQDAWRRARERTVTSSSGGPGALQRLLPAALLRAAGEAAGTRARPRRPHRGARRAPGGRGLVPAAADFLRPGNCEAKGTTRKADAFYFAIC